MITKGLVVEMVVIGYTALVWIFILVMNILGKNISEILKIANKKGISNSIYPIYQIQIGNLSKMAHISSNNCSTVSKCNAGN